MTLSCHCASINAVCHDRGGHCHRNRPGRVSPRRSITHRRYIASAISGEPHHRSSCDPEFGWSRLAQDSSWTWNLRSTAPDRSGTHKANRFRRGYEYGRAKGNCPCGQSGCRCCLRTRSRTPPIGERTKVMQIKRMRLADGMPISFDETYLPLPLRKQIVRNDLRLHPIFTLLAEEYGVPLVEADYELEAVIASKVVADALQVRGLWLDFIIFM